VLTLAAVAAFMSYGHLRAVAEGQGEDAAALFPISVDGLIIAASLVLLVQRRSGRPGGALPWAGLLLGVAATIAGNVASAEPTSLARLVAAWPPIAFALSYEFLLTLLRPPTPPAAPVPVVAVPDPAPAAEQETEVLSPPVATLRVDELPASAVGRVAAGDLLGDPAGDPPPTVQTARQLVSKPTTDQPTDAQLLERLHALLDDQAGDRAPGRRVLARELGVTEHRVRRLMAEPPTTNGNPLR